MARFTVVARIGPKVSKQRFDSLDAALAHLRDALDAPVGREPTRKVLGREYTAATQVAGRYEVRGPGVRGGLDVHGDGSLVAYRGRIRKTVVAPASGESALQALGRALRT